MSTNTATKLTADERACLLGALSLESIGRLLGPTAPRGAKACRSLEAAGLFELVGWRTAKVSGETLYRLTAAGRARALGLT